MPAFLATLLLPCAPSDRALVRSSDLAGFSEMIGFPSNSCVNINESECDQARSDGASVPSGHPAGHTESEECCVCDINAYVY
jgi:hypothetical protein